MIEVPALFLHKWQPHVNKDAPCQGLFSIKRHRIRVLSPLSEFPRGVAWRVLVDNNNKSRVTKCN